MQTTSYNFLQTYVDFNSGNECPRNFHLWTALMVLAATAHKQVHVDWGYFDIYPNMFVCLVGRQGIRKSTAKDIGAALFNEVFPDYPTGASVQSREDIIRFMASDACLMSFKDENGVLVEVRPFVVFINELKNFLSVDPQKMIEFLTDIYDRKRFKSGSIKRGLEDIENPCVNLLACEVPDWITDKLKSGIISGGWARRCVYVYELREGPPIAFPAKPPNHKAIWESLKEHLRLVQRTVGKFTWTKDARDFWQCWYPPKSPDDEIMAGYYKSKHILVLKVAMLIALAQQPIVLEITQERLELAIAMLDAIEVNMPRLSQSAGRNELAPHMQAVMEALEAKEGWIPEKALKRAMSKHLTPMEYEMVIRFLKETDQVAVSKVSFKLPPPESGDVEKVMVMTMEKYKEKMKGK